MKSYIVYITALLLGFSSLGQIKFIGDPVDIYNLNTAVGENFLVLNQHQKQMSFTKERGDDDLTDAEYIDNFYDFFDSTWKAPRVFTDWVDRKGMFSPIGFDIEGNEYFSEVTYDKGIYTGKVSKFLSNGGAVDVEIPFLKSRSAHQSGCLSKDGKYMVLAMESSYTNGVEDLYVVIRRPNGEWRSPINLGSQVNSSYQEITPFLAADNKTLYFSTNGRGGEGSFDIYSSVRQDDSWRKWSEPKNLGKEINTSGAENSFSFIDGDEWAYFVSSQNSDGYGDIKRIMIEQLMEEEDSVEADSVVVLEPEIEEPTEVEEPTVAEIISGEMILKVVDKQSRITIPAEVIYAGADLSLPDGVFTIDSTLMANKELEVKSAGYLPRIVALDSTLKIGINEIAMEPIRLGNTITLKHVLFYRSTAAMVEDAKKELDLVFEMLQDNPDIKILLKGHTDNQGDPVLNVKLSQDRVKSVKKYLTSKGISAYRIRGIGYGGNEPIADNSNEETRQLNRRVEFEVIEN